MKFYKKIFLFAFILVLAPILVSAATWTPPSVAPPNGNVPAPVNVGSTFQEKLGPLSAGQISSASSGYFRSSIGVGVVPSVGSRTFQIVSSEPIINLKDSGNPDRAWEIQAGSPFSTPGFGIVKYESGAAKESKSFFLNDTGNVGIGKSDPAYSLDVVGGVNASVAVQAPKFCFGPNLTNCITTWPGGSSFWTAGTSNSIHNSNTGNVGIGTESPAAKLQITDPPAGQPAMLIGRASGQPSIKSTSDWLIMDSNTAPAALNYWSSQNVALANGGGNVGIGTTDPQAKLDVRGTTEFRTTSGDSPATYWWSGNGYRTFMKQIDGSSGYFQIGAVDGTPIAITGANVGIGTTAPGYKLEVSGDVNVPTGSCYKVNGICIGATGPAGPQGPKGDTGTVPSGTWCGLSGLAVVYPTLCLGDNPFYSCPSGYSRTSFMGKDLLIYVCMKN